MRGRKPTPNALKMARGSTHVNPHEPRLPTGPVLPPAELTGAALAIWQEAIPALATAGIVVPADAGRLARTCTWEALGREFLSQAEVATGKVRGDLIRVASSCHANADRVWIGCGVADPRERARLKAPQEADALEAFTARFA